MIQYNIYSSLDLPAYPSAGSKLLIRGLFKDYVGPTLKEARLYTRSFDLGSYLTSMGMRVRRFTSKHLPLYPRRATNLSAVECTTRLK